MNPTIVVPVDVDAGSDAAVPFASVVARQCGGDVVLLTVVPPEADAFTPNARLSDLAERHGLGVRTRTVRADDVGLGIVRASCGPDSLICMETRGRRPLAELVLGSVAERVVRASHRPVLLVGPRCGPAPERLESMVVALDGSPLAESIVPVANQWSSWLGATPWLYQVLPVTMPLELGGDHDQDGAYVRGIAEGLTRPGLAIEWDVSRHQDPARAVAEFAAERPGALIALATHGRSGIAKVALGSVALDVTRRATVPVLVLRPQSLEGSRKPG